MLLATVWALSSVVSLARLTRSRLETQMDGLRRGVSRGYRRGLDVRPTFFPEGREAVPVSHAVSRVTLRRVAAHCFSPGTVLDCQ